MNIIVAFKKWITVYKCNLSTILIEGQIVIHNFIKKICYAINVNAYLEKKLLVNYVCRFNNQ